ncbi:hypothetical protein MBLNU459_g7471t1 [Dothideomycetes sp. NU459]
MTAAVFRGTPSLSVPQTQNTAPVLEFNCLYTHDVRRKQKRWQDGFLRFHTFNKRVMVYDVPRNFLGDMHWMEGVQLQEGDEITLEKGGVMVQVAEQVGRTETDLSELRAPKRDRPSPAKVLSSSPTVAYPPGDFVRGQVQENTTPSQMKHRSLNSLLGSTRGRIGKAELPTRSPFESRQKEQENAEWRSGRQHKRQKVDAWTVEMTTKTPKQSLPQVDNTNTSAGQIHRMKRSKIAHKESERGQRKLDVKQIIEISSDTEDTPRGDGSGRPSSITPLSECVGTLATIGRTLPRGMTLLGSDQVARTEPAVENDLSVASPSVQHRERRQLTESNALLDRVPGRMIMRESPPKNTIAATSNKEAITVLEAGSQESSGLLMNGESQKRTKSLKLISSVPRKMLVFQRQPSRTASRASESVSAKPQQTEEPRHQQPISSGPKLSTEPGSETAQHLRLQERLAQIKQREAKRREREQRERDKRENERKEDERREDERRGDERREDEKRENERRENEQRENERKEIERMEVERREREMREHERREHERKDIAQREIERREQRETRTASKPHHPPDQSGRTLLHDVSMSGTERPISPQDMDVLAGSRRFAKPTTVMAPPQEKAGQMQPPQSRPFGSRNRAKQATTYTLTAAADPLTSTLLSKPFKPPSARPVVKTTPAIAEDEVAVVKQVATQDAGPWSREAFDLMDWRPPDRDVVGSDIG